MDGTCVRECKIFEILSFVFDSSAVEVNACDAVGVTEYGADVAVEDFFVVIISELHDAITDAESLETLFERVSVGIEVSLQ